MKTDWEYLKMASKMPCTSSNYVKGHDGGGLTDEEVLIRETISNSADAQRKGSSQVRVQFKEIALEGADKKRALSSLKLDQLSISISSNLFPDQKNSLEDLLKKDSAFYSLEVSDYGTHGLRGKTETGDENDFFNLVLNLAGDNKTDSGASTSGSYGYGKTTFTKTTTLRLMTFFSIIDSDNKSNKGIFARLMSFIVFEYNSELSGFGYFGDMRADGGVDPIINDEAIKIATEIGFSDRKGEIGTSIMIHGCDYKVSNLNHLVNKYWAIPITENKLRVDLVDSDEKSSPIRPKKDPIGKILANLNEDINSGIEVDALRKVKFNSGVSVNKSFKLESSDKVSEEFFDNDFVARIRKTGMVIRYDFKDSTAFEDQIGVLYKADDSTDNILKNSENAAHNVWNENHQKLRANHGANGTKFVRSLNKRIPGLLENLRTESIKKSKSLGDARILNNLLNSLFGSKFNISGRSKLPPPGSNPKRLYSISTDKIKRNNKGDFQGGAGFQLKASGKLDKMEIVIKPRLVLVGEDGKSMPGSGVKIELLDPSGISINSGNSINEKIEILKSVKKSYTVKCKLPKNMEDCSYQLSWGTEFNEIK